MSDEGAKRKYNHLKNIIDGKYSTERYDAKDLGEDNNLDTISNDLMKSDAERHMKQLMNARPNINFDGSKAKAAEEAKASEVKEDKSKGKK